MDANSVFVYSARVLSSLQSNPRASKDAMRSSSNFIVDFFWRSVDRISIIKINYYQTEHTIFCWTGGFHHQGMSDDSSIGWRYLRSACSSSLAEEEEHSFSRNECKFDALNEQHASSLFIFLVMEIIVALYIIVTSYFSTTCETRMCTFLLISYLHLSVHWNDGL